MRRQMNTLDGVVWTVRRGSPALRRPRADDVAVSDTEPSGFLALLLSASVIGLAALTPILIQGSLFLLVGAWPVLGVVTWLLYWAWWPVVLEREGQKQHQTSVQGRRRAARLVDEFAAEIARTEDSKLTN